MSVVPIQPTMLLRLFGDSKGKVCLLYGDSMIFKLSLLIAAQAMSKSKPIAVVDGCNHFDVHFLTRFARQHHIDPEKFLKLIYVSRGFTCYQMEAVITNKLQPFLNSISSNIVMVFGLLDTFYDEQAPLREVQQILNRVQQTFQEMKALNISLLLTCTEWNVVPQERNQLFYSLKSGMDKVYRLTMNNVSKPQLFLEQQKSFTVRKGAVDYGKNCTDFHQYHR